MKSAVVFCLVLVGCSFEDVKGPSPAPRQRETFADPFVGNWSGIAWGTVAAPELACKNIWLSIEPGTSHDSLSIHGDGTCNGNKITIEKVALKIHEKKVFIGSREVGQSSRFYDGVLSDGRWFTFKLDGLRVSDQELYLGLIYFSESSGGPAVSLGVSRKADGSDGVLVGSLRPIAP